MAIAECLYVALCGLGMACLLVHPRLAGPGAVLRDQVVRRALRLMRAEGAMGCPVCLSFWTTIVCAVVVAVGASPMLLAPLTACVPLELMRLGRGSSAVKSVMDRARRQRGERRASACVGGCGGAKKVEEAA